MSKSAKYKDIYNYFRKQIEGKELLSGTPLPQEDQILKQFACSHMTVNRAMQELAQNGYIRRVPGNGSFVSNDFSKTIRGDMAPQDSLTQIITKAGLIPHTELISYSIERGRDLPAIAEAMHISDDDYVHHFTRAKFGNDRLVCICETCLNQSIVPTLDIKRLEGSLDEYMDSLGIIKSTGWSTFQAVLPTDAQKKIIGNNKDVAILKQTILWNAEGKAFELTYNNFLGDFFTLADDFRVKLNQPKAEISFDDDHQRS